VDLSRYSGPDRYRMVSESTLAVSRVRTGISARACGRACGGADATGMWTGAWRVSARASGMRRWHWTYGTWPREDVPGLGLTDEDVGLKGEHVTPRPRA